jgi:hypothetical protein
MARSNLGQASPALRDSVTAFTFNPNDTNLLRQHAFLRYRPTRRQAPTTGGLQ